jgi:hypothetical protein
MRSFIKICLICIIGINQLKEKFQKKNPEHMLNYSLPPNFDGIVIGWSSSKMVSGSCALPPRWPPQCSCVVIESSFDPGEQLQAPGSPWTNLVQRFRGEDLNVIFYQNMPNLHNRYKSAVRHILIKDRI